MRTASRPSDRIRSAALALAASAAVGGCYPYGLTGADVVLTDHRLMASGSRLAPGPVLADVGERLGLNVTEETLAASFGPVALTRFEHGEPRPLIVFCGGNMFRRSVSGARIVEALAPFGDVWIFDYPGYGGSAGEGSPAEFDAMAAVVAERVDRAFAEGRQGDLAFWGHSLGGLVCSDVAGRSRIRSDLVLVATFQSFEEVIRAGAAARAGPLEVLVRPVVGDDVPSLDIGRSLAGYGGTVIVVAARDDAVVPWLASDRLEKTLRRQGVATLRIDVPSGDHSRIHDTPGLMAQIQTALSAANFGD
jgi:uncharacterized protein